MKSSPPPHSFVRGRRGGKGLVFFPLTKSDLLLSQCEQRRLPPGPVDRSEEASLEACSFSPVGGGSVDSHLRVTGSPLRPPPPSRVAPPSPFEARARLERRIPLGVDIRSR